MLNLFAEDRFRRGFVILSIGVALALAAGALIAFGSPAIAFAIVLAAIAAAIVLSNIDFGLYAVIAVAVLLPFGALPLNIGFNPTLLDLALLALFGMWAARGLTRQGSAFVATPLGLPILSFLVLAVFSFIAGTAYAPITQEVLRHFAEVLISIALFFVVVNVLPTRDALGRFVTALIVAGFISAAIGIFLYFIPTSWSIQILSALRVFKYPSGDGILRFIEDDPNNPMRAISTSVDPNVLGGLMILVTALDGASAIRRQATAAAQIARGDGGGDARLHDPDLLARSDAGTWTRARGDRHNALSPNPRTADLGRGSLSAAAVYTRLPGTFP